MTTTAFTFRAVTARPYEGKPVWHGQARRTRADRWQTVKNHGGQPIAYATDEAALRAAKLFRDGMYADDGTAAHEKMKDKVKTAMRLLEQVMTGPGILPSRRGMVSDALQLLRHALEKAER